MIQLQYITEIAVLNICQVQEFLQSPWLVTKGVASIFAPYLVNLDHLALAVSIHMLDVDLIVCVV